jgi:uncharacterized protein
MPTIEQASEWYTDTDPVHDFGHIQRVYWMAEKIGSAENADMEIVRAAALLHDAEDSAPGGDGSERANHHNTSALFARRILEAEGWSEERIARVQHCIRAHRFRGKEEAPSSIEAKAIFDSDKLDVLGAVGVARTIAYAVLDHKPVYSEPSLQFIQTGKEIPGELHSSYHEYLFKLSKVKDRLFTATGKKIAEQRHAFLVEYYERLANEMKGLD